MKKLLSAYLLLLSVVVFATPYQKLKSRIDSMTRSSMQSVWRSFDWEKIKSPEKRIKLRIYFLRKGGQISSSLVVKAGYIQSVWRSFDWEKIKSPEKRIKLRIEFLRTTGSFAPKFIVKAGYIQSVWRSFDWEKLKAERRTELKVELLETVAEFSPKSAKNYTRSVMNSISTSIPVQTRKALYRRIADVCASIGDRAMERTARQRAR